MSSSTPATSILNGSSGGSLLSPSKYPRKLILPAENRGLLAELSDESLVRQISGFGSRVQDHTHITRKFGNIQRAARIGSNPKLPTGWQAQQHGIYRAPLGSPPRKYINLLTKNKFLTNIDNPSWRPGSIYEADEHLAEPYDTPKAAPEVRMSRISSKEENYEVAALRRQVELLIMALKKKNDSGSPPKANVELDAMNNISRSSHRDLRPRQKPLPPFAPPQPPRMAPPGRQASHGYAVSRQSAINFSKYQRRYSPEDNVYDPTDAMVRERMMCEQEYARHVAAVEQGYYDPRRARPSNLSDYARYHGISGPASSVAWPEESINVGSSQQDNVRVDELAKKIEALESLFTSATLTVQQNAAGAVAPAPCTASTRSSNTSRPSHSIDRGSMQPSPFKLYSDSIIDLPSGSRPASAYNFNATGPVPAGQDQPKKKGKLTSMFKLGAASVSTDRIESSRTAQVSWSRKRTEKAEVPKVKLKQGPGRGRVYIVQPKA